jgi:hypothetical protein
MEAPQLFVRCSKSFELLQYTEEMLPVLGDVRNKDGEQRARAFEIPHQIVQKLHMSQPRAASSTRRLSAVGGH